MLSTEAIRDSAYIPTGQSHNSDWISHPYGKLMSLNFGRAISVMGNRPSAYIQRHREQLNAPTKVKHGLPFQVRGGSCFAGDRCLSQQKWQCCEKKSDLDFRIQLHGCLSRRRFVHRTPRHMWRWYDTTEMPIFAS